MEFASSFFVGHNGFANGLPDRAGLAPNPLEGNISPNPLLFKLKNRRFGEGLQQALAHGAFNVFNEVEFFP